MKPHFELRRVRDFGEIISDSFTFFKDNFKTLMKPLLVICGFFILIGTFAYTFMQSNLFEGISQTAGGPVRNNTFENPLWTTNYLGGMLLFYFIFAFYLISIFIVTYSYIAIYLEKPENEKPSVIEVWGYYKYYFWRILGSSIVCILITAIGSVLCLLPGIYIGTVLSLAMPIIIFENASFGFAFNKSFTLIKGNWWLTFGTMFIISLIIGFGSYFVNAPMIILTVTKMLLKWDFWIFPLLLICGLLVNVFYLAYSLMAIATSMCYFSYCEQKEGTGLMNRIDMLGKTGDDNSHLPTEEY